MAFMERGAERGLPDLYCWICGGVGDPYDPEGCCACGTTRIVQAFTDDLRELSRAEQIARVQAVAREHGDELTDREAGDALSLYLTQATTINASRDGRRMQPLTMGAPDARAYADALELNGFKVRLEREAGA